MVQNRGGRKLELKPGKMICLYVHKYPTDWSQVADVIDCSDSNVLTVCWYDASYTGFSQQFRITKKKQKVDWIEKVHKDDILFYPFDLL